MLKKFAPANKQITVTLRWVLGIVGTVAIILIIIYVPAYQRNDAFSRIDSEAVSKLEPKDRVQLDKDLTTLENSARLTIAQIIGGLILLSGLYFTWRTVKANEEGKLTERYSKAVELLGSDKLDIRLGGIYALERIAIDSKKDHWTIMEVLCSFVRENSPYPPRPATAETAEDNATTIAVLTAFIRDNGLIKTETQVAETVVADAPKDEPIAETLPPVKADIQAAVTVIGRRKHYAIEREDQIIDLSKTDLSGLDLRKANLEGANFYRANLQNTRLREANLLRTSLLNTNLQNASLEKADLRESGLNYANLQKANLGGANLQKSYLGFADLKMAILYAANLQDAKLGNTKLQGAIVDKANLKKASLRKANLERASLQWADLQQANLEDANLQGAILHSANLKGTILSNADLQGASLYHANLIGTILHDANLQNTEVIPRQIKEANINDGTLLPFDRKKLEGVENETN